MSGIIGPLSRAHRRERSRDTILLVRETFGYPFDPSEKYTSGTPAHWTDESSAHLSSWLKRNGSSFENLSMLRCGLGNSFAFERNHRWKDFPVIGRPKYEFQDRGAEIYGVTSNGSLSSDPSCRWRHPEALLIETKAILYDAPTLDDRMVWDAIRLFHDEVLDSGVPVFHFDGLTILPVPSEYLQGLISRGKLSDRLAYNLHANLSVFMSRCAFDLASRENWPVRSLEGKVGRSALEVSSPLAIQMLFDLAEVPGEAPAIPCDFSNAPVDEMIAGSPFWFIEQADGKVIFVWKGTGTYPPLRLNPRSSRTNTIGISSPARNLAVLAARGYVGIDENGDLRLTREARGILGAIGNGVRDLDLPLRWIGRGMEHGQSVDRWLNTTLRKVKRKVAPLGREGREMKIAGALSSRSDESDAPFHRRHGMCVHASAIALPKDLSPEAKNEIERLKSIERSTSFQDRTFGFVRTPARVNKDAEVAIWFGVPLGIFHPYRLRLIHEESLTQLEGDIERAGRNLPSEARDSLGEALPPCVFVTEWTDLPEKAASDWWAANTKPVPDSLYPKLGPV